MFSEKRFIENLKEDVFVYALASDLAIFINKS